VSRAFDLEPGVLPGAGAARLRCARGELLLGVPTRAIAAAAFATVAVCGAVSPATLAAGPVLCPLRRMTGLPCPGCGLTRSCAACFHGDLGLSVSFHPFGPLVCAAALAVVALVVLGWLTRSRPLDGAVLAVQRVAPVRLAGALLFAAWLAWAVARAVAAGV
jgi:hypothetical protein